MLITVDGVETKVACTPGPKMIYNDLAYTSRELDPGILHTITVQIVPTLVPSELESASATSLVRS